MLSIVKIKGKTLYLKRENIYETKKKLNAGRINIFSNYKFFLKIIFLFTKKKYKKICETKDFCILYNQKSQHFLSIWFFNFKYKINKVFKKNFFCINKSLTNSNQSKFINMFNNLTTNKLLLYSKKFQSCSKLEALNFHNKLFKFYSYFCYNKMIINIFNNYPQKIPNMLFKFFNFNCFYFDLNNQYGFILKNLTTPVFIIVSKKLFIRADNTNEFFLINQKPIYKPTLYIDKQKQLINPILLKINRLKIPFWKILFNTNQKKLNFLTKNFAKKNFKMFILYNYGRLALKHDFKLRINKIKIIKKIIFKNILQKNNEIILNIFLNNKNFINYIDTDSLFSIKPFSLKTRDKKIGYLKVLEFLNWRYKFFFIKSLKRYFTINIKKNFYWIVLKYKSTTFYNFNTYVFLRNLLFFKKNKNQTLKYKSLSSNKQTNV